MNKLILSLMVLVPLSFSYAGPKGDGPCRADIEKLCQGVNPGGGALMKCLRDNKDNLSAECKAQREKMKGVKEVCQADAESLCGEVKKGHGQMMKCMRANLDKLSAECKAEMENLPKMQGMKK